MKIMRIIKGSLKFRRYGEMVRCFRFFNKPFEMIFGFLGLKTLDYPLTLTYKRKYQLVIESWEDLTTASVVLLGKEYRIFPTDKIIVDFGANIGCFALLAGDLNPDSRIFAVEPFPKNFALLQETIKKNSQMRHVFLRKCAISGENGEVAFDASDSIPSHSRRISKREGKFDRILVPSCTLEAFLEAEKLSEVDFIKMDIEGAEYDVILNSSEATLRRAKRYGMEYHSKGHESISKRFQQAGFKISYFPKKGKSGVIEYKRSISRYDAH